MVNQKTLMSGLGIAWIFIVAAVAAMMAVWLENALEDYSRDLSDISSILSPE
jgi:hypothetical protein